jgi:hypothetical protein
LEKRVEIIENLEAGLDNFQAILGVLKGRKMTTPRLSA